MTTSTTSDREMIAGYPATLFSSPEDKVFQKKAIKYLHEVCRREGVKVIYDYKDKDLVGSYNYLSRTIRLNPELVQDSGKHLETLLHELIHVMQFTYGQFKAQVVEDHIYIGTLDHFIPYDDMREVIEKGWGEAYGNQFEKFWLDEVAPLALEGSYFWFHHWYEKTHGDHKQVAA